MSSLAGETARRLAAMTDAADFERLASAVLRRARPAVYGNISHPGTQPGGKTVPAPFDNVGWVNTPGGSTFVCAAHSTTEQNKLNGKWLHDPATVTPRGASGRPTQPPGDLVKGIEEITALRAAHPELTTVVFALTTNRETPADARTAAEALAIRHNIELDVWSASRIADFLDLTPEGQVIRHRHFGDSIRLLSQALLTDIGVRSLRDHLRMPPAAEIVARADTFGDAGDVLLVGESGMGKSTAAGVFLRDYLEGGRPALVLRTEFAQSATTLEDALDAELRRQVPSLESGSGAKALELVSQAAPLVILVEDVERTESPSRLLNKLLSWSLKEPSDKRAWRLLIPVWWRTLGSIENWDAVKKSVATIEIRHYSAREATDAVERRFHAVGKTVDRERAEQIARDLGGDPLLIGLLDVDAPSKANEVIETYVRTRTAAAAAACGEPTSELAGAVDMLVLRMLEHRQLTPQWSEAISWAGVRERAVAIKAMLAQADVLRLRESEDDESFEFRHDRVRDYLASRALATIRTFSADAFPVLADPFFARVAGAAALRGRTPKEALGRLSSTSPLVAFYALQVAVKAQDAYADIASEACANWLRQDGTRADTHFTHRVMAAEVLKGIRSSHVKELVALFPAREQNYDPLLAARFRNGHVGAGVALLARYELGVQVRGKDELVADVQRTYGEALLTAVEGLLKDDSLDRHTRSGLLRLTGYLGHAKLAGAVRQCWTTDAERLNNLRAYLFAAARCCRNEAATTLGPVCDAWELLSDEEDELGRTDVSSLASEYVAWEFTRFPPLDALEYFVERARQSKKLIWPITYMLRSVDAPEVVEHLARFAADREAISTHFLFSDWERHARESGRKMSVESRARLWTLANDASNADVLQRRALRLWDFTVAAGDLEALRSVDPASPIFQDAVMGRARRADYTSVPYLVQFIPDNPRYWLQVARYFWSSELTAALAGLLAKLAAGVKGDGEDEGESAIAYAMRRLNAQEAYNLLAPHWSALGKRPRFVQEALYFAEPKLLELAAQAVQASSEPKNLFEHFTLHITMNSGQRYGFRRIEEVAAVQPYLDFLEPLDLFVLWEACTKNGWIDFRQAYLDALVRNIPDYAKHLPGDSIDMKDLDRRLAGTIVPLYIWLEQQQRSGATKAEALAALLSWLQQHPGPAASDVVAEVLSAGVARAELPPFEQVALTRDDFAQALIPVKFRTESRTLV